MVLPSSTHLGASSYQDCFFFSMWLDAAPSFTRVKLDGAARDMSNAAARVLFSGDVCGKLDALCKRVAFVNKRNGPFDALVCVGQFLPSDADGVDGMQVYLQGKKTFPLPTYFIGDYGECSGILLSGARAEAAKVGLTSNGIRVCDNLFWLKGSGILTLKGLRIAFLGGKHDATVYRDPKAAAAAGAHHEDDVDALRALADDPGVVDVFLSNEWPSGILKFADSSVVPEALSQPASGERCSCISALNRVSDCAMELTSKPTLRRCIHNCRTGSRVEAPLSYCRLRGSVLCSGTLPQPWRKPRYKIYRSWLCRE